MVQTAPVLQLGEFFGEAVRRRQILGFAMVENRFEPGRRIPPHRHALSHITCLIEGGFRETYDDRVLECGQGAILIVPQSRIHEDEIGPTGAHTISIEIGPKTFVRLEETVPVLREPQVLEGPAIARAVDRLYSEFRAPDDASLPAIASIALDLIVQAQRRQASAPRFSPTWMDEILAEIHRDPKAGASLGELAARYEVHESHLARCFRRRHGCSLGEYVRWLRLESAKSALLNPSQSLAEIAHEAGYFDQAHFSRAFRRAYAISPSAYRRGLG